MRSGAPAAPTRRRCARRCRRRAATRACTARSMRPTASPRASASASIPRAWWCACTKATGRAACCMSEPGKGIAMEKFVPIRGLHHWAYRCRDAEETRHFYEDLLGLPLTHFIREDEYVGTSGERVEKFAHIFFEMADGSSLAFFDLGDDVAAEPSPNTPRWCNHMAPDGQPLAQLEAAHQA